MKTTQHNFNNSSQWTIYSNAFELIRSTLDGGCITLKAYKDYTCELPIKLIIDTDANEIFVSVTIINTRSTRSFCRTPDDNKSLITQQIINFIEQVANSGIQSGNETITLSFINPKTLGQKIKRNIDVLGE